MESSTGEQAGPHLEIADVFLSRTILRLVPHSVSPNALTITRFISVPIVVALLIAQNYAWGMAVFAVAALTDALDGAMARTRNQITRWGKVADPFADKLLIGATTLILVVRFVNMWVASIIVGLECALIARAVYRHTRRLPAGANAMGKTKMVLQSLALLVLFAYTLSGAPIFMTLATGGLVLAILFALAGLLSEPSR